MPYCSTPTWSSPSSKVSRSRSLPIKAFTRRLSHDYGGSFRDTPLLEDTDDFDHAQEYQRLIELEKSNKKQTFSAKYNSVLCGTVKQEATHCCIGSLRGSREEVLYEDDDEESIANEDQQPSKPTNFKSDPTFSRAVGCSRLESQSVSSLAEILGESEGFVAGEVASEIPIDSVLAHDLCASEDSEEPVVEVNECPRVPSQQDLLLSPRSCDSNHSNLPIAAEFVDIPLDAEPVSANSDFHPYVEFQCNDSVSAVFEDNTLLEVKSLLVEDEDHRISTAFNCLDTAEVCHHVPSDNSLIEASNHSSRANKHSGKLKTWRRLKRITIEKGEDSSVSAHLGCEGEENMNGRGKVNISFTNPGKRSGSQRTSFADTRDLFWDPSCGKKMKDGMGAEDLVPSDIQPDAFAWGLVGHSDPFLGYDAAGFFAKVPVRGDQMSATYTRRSPVKNSKGTALARKVRGLRASPKPVSSLESCLMAQMADSFDRNRVKTISRSLNFSTSITENGELEKSRIVDGPALPRCSNNAVDDSISVHKQSSLPSLPNLSKFLKEYAANLASTSTDESSANGGTSNPSASDNGRTLGASNDGNCSTVASFETLLFSFGVGLGVLFGSGSLKSEVKRLSQLLEETQANFESLKLELSKRKSPAGMNSSDVASVNGLQQEDEMADLEAELEAELDQLTGGDSATVDSQYSAYDELDTDGVVSVVHGDLAPTGLPARIEEDSDEDLSPPTQAACLNNCAVSPRELTRLLRKLQAARQDELITELEEDLKAAQSKLLSREKELELLKERLSCLTEASFASAFGDECLIPCTPTKGVTPVDRVSIISEEVSAAPRSDNTSGCQDCSQDSRVENGASVSVTASEKYSGGPELHLNLRPVRQELVKTSLHSESTKQQELEGNGRSLKGSEISKELEEEAERASNEFLQSMFEFVGEGPSHAEVAARDCRPMLGNAQIITQLIDSVHGLESCDDRAESVELCSTTPNFGIFSSSVSISDTWDHPVDSATPELFKGGGTRGVLSSRTKLAASHSIRRTTRNCNLDNPKLNRKFGNEISPSPNVDYCAANIKHTEGMESSKTVSDISDAETANLRTPHSVNYIDSTAKPASEPVVPADDDPSFWVEVGRAGLTTPVEKVRQQLFKMPQSAPVQWSGELSPTVLEKIARWEGLMEGETPGPASGCDWECQSRASELEQQCDTNWLFDGINVFSEENLMLEADEMLERMLIKRIVEESKFGSDSLVRKAQTALATLEREDSVETDICHGEDEYLNERTDSEADFWGGASDSKEEWNEDQENQSNTLDSAVREECEFFSRLQRTSKDRRAMKVLREKSEKVLAVAGGIDLDVIPNGLVSRAQLSTGDQPFGFTDVSTEECSDWPAKGKYVKALVASNNRVLESELTCGDAKQFAYRLGSPVRQRGGYREDEGRSRRRF